MVDMFSTAPKCPVCSKVVQGSEITCSIICEQVVHDQLAASRAECERYRVALVKITTETDTRWKTLVLTPTPEAMSRIALQALAQPKGDEDGK